MCECGYAVGRHQFTDDRVRRKYGVRVNTALGKIVRRSTLPEQCFAHCGILANDSIGISCSGYLFICVTCPSSLPAASNSASSPSLNFVFSLLGSWACDGPRSLSLKMSFFHLKTRIGQRALKEQQNKTSERS